ncbi:MAG: hypothetical protein EOO41_04570, partial [Methanobacteriota archaeon]
MLRIFGSGFSHVLSPPAAASLSNATVSAAATAAAALWQRTVCVFNTGVGRFTTAASVVSDEQAVCLSPSVPEPAASNTVPATIEISTVAGLVTRSGVRFMFTPSLVVQRVSPALGSTMGGTRVTVTVPHVRVGERVFCKLGDAPAQLGEAVNTSAVTFLTPATAAARTVSVLLSLNGVEWFGAQTGHVPGDSLRDLEWVDHSTDNLFTYVQPPRVDGVSPRIGFANHATHMRVRGAHFVWHPSLSCFVGDMSFPARFVSTNEVQCTMPPRPAALERVGVCINGVDIVMGADMAAATLLIVPQPHDVRASPALIPSGAGAQVQLNLHARLRAAVQAAAASVNMNSSTLGSALVTSVLSSLQLYCRVEGVDVPALAAANDTTICSLPHAVL